MVTQCHRPEERNRVQAFNDFLIFGSMAIGSFSSGKLLANFGWDDGQRGHDPVRACGLRTALRLGLAAAARAAGVTAIGAQRR